MEMVLSEKDNIGSLLYHIEKTVKETKWFPKNPGKCHIIFRGEPCLYQTALLPKLFRPNIYKQHQESEIFDEFQRQHPEYYSKCHNEFDWLNVMQHYDVPTRLLDWTFSLPVALYFATELPQHEKAENIIDDNGVLYFKPISVSETINPYEKYDKHVYDTILKLIRASKPADVEELFRSNSNPFDGIQRDLFTYRPRYIHNRIRNQQGLFTVSTAKVVHDFSKGLNFMIISPDATCINTTDFKNTFLKNTRFFSCSNQRSENPKKIEEFDQITKDSEFNNILMLVTKETGKIDLYTKKTGILQIEEKIKPSFTKNIDTYLSASPTEALSLPEENAHGILISFTNSLNPIILTKLLNWFKEKSDKDYLDLSQSQGILKIVIPNNCKQNLRKQLHIMGTNYSCLFPEPSNFYKGFSERKYPLT